jgi:chaperonin GroEL
MTGATPITSALDIAIQEVKLSHLGQAGKVIVGKDRTLIIDGAGACEDIASRAAELRSLVSHASGNERDLLQQRLAALSGGMVVIRVGGFTETEANEKKYRVEDAMHAVRAATEEGIIPGGGTALARASVILNLMDAASTADEKVGIGIVARAITRPLCLIAENAGQDGADVLARVLFSPHYDFGYNALTDTDEDLMAAGVIDPAKVVRTALRNAASIAGTMLTTAVLISEIRGKYVEG